MGNVNSTSTTRTPIPQSTQTSSQSDPSQDPAAQSQSAGTTQSPDAAPQSQAGTIDVPYDFFQPGGTAWRLEPASCEK